MASSLISNHETETNGLSISRKIFVFIAILLWISIFIGGILVNSEPYRQIISNYSFTNVNNEAVTTDIETEPPNFFIALLVVALCYTPSNLILLCMFSGLLGALSRIAKLHIKDASEDEIPSDTIDPLMSGILRGLFVFLLAISGILLINDTPITNPGQSEYVRLAGLLSILSFLLSYNPSRFQSFVAKGIDTVQTKMKIKDVTQ
jgi:hypothetical protein